jgi:hypothetical protein
LSQAFRLLKAYRAAAPAGERAPLVHDGTNEGIRYGAARSTEAEQAFASPFRPRVS